MFPFRGIGDALVCLRDFLEQMVGVNGGLLFAFSRRLRLLSSATPWCFRMFLPLIHILTSSGQSNSECGVWALEHSLVHVGFYAATRFVVARKL
jgi:hypothetical protein